VRQQEMNQLVNMYSCPCSLCMQFYRRSKLYDVIHESYSGVGIRNLDGATLRCFTQAFLLSDLHGLLALETL
jgi:hypothetical protein